jgi:hypothetical protein
VAIARTTAQPSIADSGASRTDHNKKFILILILTLSQFILILILILIAMHGSAAIFGRPGERRSLGLWLRREICGGRRALCVDPGPARWRADLDWPLATPRSKDTSPVQINVKAATPALLGERRGWRR